MPGRDCQIFIALYCTPARYVLAYTCLSVILIATDEPWSGIGTLVERVTNRPNLPIGPMCLIFLGYKIINTDGTCNLLWLKMYFCVSVCLFVRLHISLECHFLLVIEVRPTALYERYRLFHIVDPNLNPKFDLDP